MPRRRSPAEVVQDFAPVHILHRPESCPRARNSSSRWRRRRSRRSIGSRQQLASPAGRNGRCPPRSRPVLPINTLILLLRHDDFKPPRLQLGDARLQDRPPSIISASAHRAPRDLSTEQLARQSGRGRPASRRPRLVGMPMMACSGRPNGRRHEADKALAARLYSSSRLGVAYGLGRQEGGVHGFRQAVLRAAAAPASPAVRRPPPVTADRAPPPTMAPASMLAAGAAGGVSSSAHGQDRRGWSAPRDLVHWSNSRSGAAPGRTAALALCDDSHGGQGQHTKPIELDQEGATSHRAQRPDGAGREHCVAGPLLQR